jgi:hypothetical protein
MRIRESARRLTRTWLERLRSKGLFAIAAAGAFSWVMLAVVGGILSPPTLASDPAMEAGIRGTSRLDEPVPLSNAHFVTGAGTSGCVDSAWGWIETLGSGTATTNDLRRHLARRDARTARIVMEGWTQLNQRAFWIGQPKARAEALKRVEELCGAGNSIRDPVRTQGHRHPEGPSAG